MNPWDEFRETPEERQRRADISAEVSSDPRNFLPEEQHLVKTGGVAAPAAAVSGPWEQFQGEVAASGPWSQFEPEKKRLLSLEGAGGLLRSIGPSIMQGIQGSRLSEYEAIKSAYEGAVAKGNAPAVSEQNYQDALVKIPEITQRLTEYERELREIKGDPSLPLEVAHGVTASVAENVIPLTGAVIARGAPGAAAVPLTSAQRSAEGHAYAEARTPNPETGKVKTSDVAQARLNSKVQGYTEFGFELMPTTWLMKHLGKTGFGEFAYKYLVRELGTELPTTAANKISEWSTIEQDKPVGEFLSELKDELIMTGLVTPFSAGMTAGVATGVAKATSALDRKPSDPTAPLAAPPPVVPPEVLDNAGISEPIMTASPDADTTPAESGQLAAVLAEMNAVDPETIDDAKQAEAKRDVAEFEAAKKTPGLPQADVHWSMLSTAPQESVDVGEIGASLKQARNAANYRNENEGDRLDRPILFSTDQNAVGLTPRQILPMPGTYVLGVATDDRPESLLRPLMETGEQYRQKYMPKATLIFSNEQLFSDSALGWHYTMGDNKHLIVPAVLRKMKDPSKFNKNTQAGVFYNFTHEFGHALLEERLFESVNAETATKAKLEGRVGVISEETLAEMPTEVAEMLREFNAIKSRIMSDEMTAGEFVDSWVGPAKQGRKFLKELQVAEEDTANAVMRAVVRRATERSNIRHEVSQGKLRQKLKEDFFSFEEYFAEQASRYAYAKKSDQGTALGKFLQKGLDALRKFFSEVKADGLIAPGVKFSEWLDGLPQVSRLVNEDERVVESKLKAGKRKVKAPVAKVADVIEKVTKPQRSKVRLPKVAHNAMTEKPAIDKQQYARKLVTNLVRTGVIEIKDNSYNELMDLINRSEWGEFFDAFQGIAGKTVKFELDSIAIETGDSFINDKKYFYHAVRDEKDLDSIFQFGLIAGTNVSKSDGQALSGEGETVLVFSRSDYRTRSKEYQDDEIVLGGTGKPVAIFKDTQPFEREGIDQEEANSRYRDLEERSNRGEFKQEEQLWDRMDKIQDITGKDPVTSESLLQPLAKYGVRVFNYRSEWNDALDKAEITFPGQTAKISSNKFDSPEFRAWFGDWEHSPELASVARIGVFRENEQGVLGIASSEASEPLVVFASLAQLKEGGGVHASTVRGAHYVASATGVDSSSLVPVVLNIRKPYIVSDVTTAVPSQQELEVQGHDSVVYRSNLEGHIGFHVFNPEQIKLIPSRSVHMELDGDLATPEGESSSRVVRGIKDFMGSPLKPFKRALRFVTRGQRFVLQLQQQAHIYPHLSDLLFMAQKIINYNSYKSTRQISSDTNIGEWKYRGPSRHRRIGKALIAESESGGHWFGMKKTTKMRQEIATPWYEFEMTEDAKVKLKENGIDIETEKGAEDAALLLRVKNDLLDFLNEDEQILFNLIALRYASSTKTRDSKTNDIRKQIHELRKVPFFPRGRFGNMVLIIRRKRTKGAGSEVVYREQFEQESNWVRAWDNAQKNKTPDLEVSKEILTDQEAVLMSMPVDFLDMMASELGLSDQPGPNGEESQIDRLQAILQPIKPEKLLKEYDLEKLKIKGFSTDAMRSYAEYTWHHSNLQAKLLHRQLFNVAITGINNKIITARRSEDPASIEQLKQLMSVKASMEGTKEYMMSPPYEAHTARAFVSLAYLWGSLKTGVLNFAWLQSVVIDMETRHGALSGTKRFMQAVHYAGMSMKLSSINDVRQGNILPPDLQKGVDRATEEGVLQQSMAYHLAGAANATSLSRMWLPRFGQNVTQRAVDVGLFPFRLVEMTTRRTTFFASLQENLETKGFDEAYLAAVSYTNLMQGEYSPGNRIPFMRGLKVKWKPLAAAPPMLTIFGTFAQLMAFHTYAGYELGQRRKIRHQIEEGELPFGAMPTKKQLLYGYTARMWMLFFMLAGYMGMPMMENIIDMLSALWRQMGGKKPLKQELRELVQSIGGDPWMWSRGMGHNVAGMDISRSIGSGDIIPGMRDFGSSRDQSIEKTLGNVAVDMAGVAGAMLKFGWSFKNKPWEEAMLGAPGGVGAMYNAYYWSEHGVRGPNDAQITLEKQPDGSEKPRDLTSYEIAMKALGFNPTIVSENREKIYGQHDVKMFWQAKRSGLLEYWDRANWQDDDQARDDVRKTIEEFNDDLGDEDDFRAMRILPKDLSIRERTRRKNQAKIERGQPIDKRTRGAQESFQRSFDDPNSRQE